VEEQTGQRLEEVDRSIKIRQRRSIGFGVIAHTAFKRYPKRTVLGLSLFIGQAFLYDAVFFTQALVLTTFFKVSDSVVPASSRSPSGPARAAAARPPVRHRRPPAHDHPVLHAVRGAADRHRAAVQRRRPVGHHPDRLLGGVFFFASAGASAAYLTGSEIFPMETRAMALAFFYAVGTGIGGVTGPALFGKLVETGKEVNVFYGYLLGAALMIAAGCASGSSGSRRPASRWRTWPGR
jgi:hypothetical protein